VVVAPSQGSGVFFASGLAAAPSGSTYQGWLIDADGGIRSAGLFAPNADATAVLLLTDDLATAREFAITVEPAGGSDQPTVLPPVLGVSVPA
jgi:anti-sigma-K factor RskA